MNEVEKKEIYEMARLTCAYSAHVYNDCKDCCHNPCAHKYNAEALYKVGYRKVLNEKGINVFDSWKAKLLDNVMEIERLKKEIESLNKKISNLKEDLIHADEKVFYRECNVALRENEIRQQAIKEFAKRLYDKYGRSCSEYYPELIELTHKELDDLLKEYENDIRRNN